MGKPKTQRSLKDNEAKAVLRMLRTSGGRHPVSPWGKPTKGKKTRSNKSTDKFIVRSRHVKKGR